MKSTDSRRQVGDAILCVELRAFYIVNSRDGSRAVSCPQVVITLRQRKQGAIQNSLAIAVPKMNRFLLFLHFIFYKMADFLGICLLIPRDYSTVMLKILWQFYSRTPVSRTLKGNEKHFALAGNWSYRGRFQWHFD